MIFDACWRCWLEVSPAAVHFARMTQDQSEICQQMTPRSVVSAERAPLIRGDLRSWPGTCPCPRMSVRAARYPDHRHRPHRCPCYRRVALWLPTSATTHSDARSSRSRPPAMSSALGEKMTIGHFSNERQKSELRIAPWKLFTGDSAKSRSWYLLSRPTSQ